MRVLVNGREHEVPQGCTVGEIARSVGAPGAGWAIAVDQEVVPRADWENTTLGPDAHVEVLTAVAGG